MKILKFGGSSLNTPEKLRRVLQIIQDQVAHEQIVVVVSALGGVTDRLLQIFSQSRTALHEAYRELTDIFHNHTRMLQSLYPEEVPSDLYAAWGHLKQESMAILAAWSTQPDAPEGRYRDAFLAIGEKLSARLIATLLNLNGSPAVWVDADRLIRTDDHFGQAEVDFGTTQKAILSHPIFQEFHRVPVVTGFIGTTALGETTTLGRDGSDYTASILGALLNASAVEIWTDVDGILTADPDVVPGALPIPQLSYMQAAELAWFGARVLHPKTIHPLEQRDIPLVIKNTHHPEHPGTRVTRDSASTPGIRSLVSKRELAEVVIHFPGHLDVQQILTDVYALSRQMSGQVFISPLGIPKSGIRILTHVSDQKEFLQKFQERFNLQLKSGEISLHYSQESLGLITIIGEGLITRLNLPVKISAMMKTWTPVFTVFSYSNTETHLAFVVADEQLPGIMRHLHDHFFHRVKSIYLAIAGATGNVGQQFLGMIQEHYRDLRQQRGIDLRIMGIINRRWMAWDVEGLPVNSLTGNFPVSETASWPDFLSRILQTEGVPVLFIDCTACPEIAQAYGELLRHRVGVITASKIANTLDLEYYRHLKRVAIEGGIPYLYHTTVGAGTPFIRILRQLHESGETVYKIEGSLSGTLSFVFDQLNQGKRFSEAVHLAWKQGYTEPHPAVDLQGTDVARKLLILLREIGIPLELQDIAVESLTPPDLASVDSPVAFLEQLSAEDDRWTQRVADARQQGKRLMYLATFNGREARVGVQTVDEAEADSWPGGVLNQLRIYTSRFYKQPLIIQGPGAGPRFTAQGLFQDLLAAIDQIVSLQPEKIEE
ncbi:MAG: aspartate kinase [Calditrichaeota bacterium]|nr:aspartate kinase [Calditrichota bacterium]